MQFLRYSSATDHGSLTGLTRRGYPCRPLFAGTKELAVFTKWRIGDVSFASGDERKQNLAQTSQTQARIPPAQG